jgi:ankyrin repeat protein
MALPIDTKFKGKLALPYNTPFEKFPPLSIQETAQLAKAHAQAKYLFPKQIQSNLIRRNANYADEEGHTPLIYAVASDWPDAVQVLIEHGADVNKAGGSLKWTPLMWAAFLGQTRNTILLLTAKASLDATDREGHSALAIAASRGHAATAEILLKHGANPNLRGKDSLTPLMWAVRKDGHWQMADLLLKYGADLEARDAWGRTALMHSAIHDRSAIRVLIKYNANLFAQDNNGDTALHYAAKSGATQSAIEIIYAMARRGRIVIKNAKGETAADVAEKNGYHQLAEMIRRFLKTGELPKKP